MAKELSQLEIDEIQKELNKMRVHQLSLLQSVIKGNPEHTGYKTREHLISLVEAQEKEIHKFLLSKES